MSASKNLHDNRMHYNKHELTEDKISPNPFEQFGWWMEDALQSSIIEPNAMALATVGHENQPAARMVLLKSFDEKGFVFYTNYLSRKGAEISNNNHGALLFWWDVLERQVRIEGSIEKVAVHLSDEYFATRPYESRLSAIVSEQSAEIASRFILEDKLEALKKEGHIQRPENWGGYILVPKYFEFWQGRASRLHDRIYFKQTGSEAWQIGRLAP